MSRIRQPKTAEQVHDEARVQAFSLRSELEPNDLWERAAFDVESQVLAAQSVAVAAGDLATVARCNRQLTRLGELQQERDRYENRLHQEIPSVYEAVS